MAPPQRLGPARGHEEPLKSLNTIKIGGVAVWMREEFGGRMIRIRMAEPLLSTGNLHSVC